MDDAVKNFLSEIGKKGGSSKSEKKLKALEMSRAKWSKIAKARRKNAKTK